METDIQVLKSRLERLERANRRMWCAGIVVLTLGVTALLFMQAHKARVVEAEQFVLRDSMGEKRGGMIVTSQGPALELYDSNRTLRLVLSIFNGMPNLTIKDARGTGVAVLADAPSGPGLMIYDRNGEPRAQLDVGAGGPRLYLEDQDGFAATVGNYYTVDPAFKNQKLVAASVVLSHKRLGVIWHAP